MDSTSLKVGLAALELARSDRFEALHERFAAPLRALVTADSLRVAWTAALERSGPVTAVGSAILDEAPGVTTVKVPLQCERGALTLLVAVTRSGDLAGIQLAPADAIAPASPWEPPAYADRSRFDEQELSLGADPLGVGATLSLPHVRGRVPGVVLLAGSGPSDRDGTIGPNRPLRDLAWGLAARDVAVLRFDKVTAAHPDEVRANRAFTLTDEYVPQARAALEFLRGHPAVDPQRLVVAGHSLGGTVAPRVAAAALPVAGIAILAGGAAPLHWTIVRQFRYLASLDPAAAAGAGPVIETLTRQARLVDSPDLSPSTPTADLPLGTPASYWLDLRDDDAAAALAALGIPVLVLQGGRDYQATVDDDLARWQAALAGRPDVTVRVHPSDDHCFFPGSGRSSAQETMRGGQHVDPAVIEELASWVAGLPPASSRG